jgi:hypothetical protein
MGLKLKADPTFLAKVEVPLPGGAFESVEFKFKHRKSSELQAWLLDIANKPNADVVTECVEGWGLTDEFNRSNVELLLDTYPRAARAIVDAYTFELTGRRLGN